MVCENCQKSISEDEVSDCISEKVDEGWDRERAVAACLSMAEEGSTEPEKQNQEYEVGDTTVDITPPDQMVNAAEAAQTAQEEGVVPGECGTGVGDRRADQITNDEVGPDVIDEIASYLTSHEEDVTAEGSPTDWNEEEWSDCGNAQYAKWGGVNDGEMKRWAQEKANEVAEARGEELPYPERRENYTMSLDNPQFEIGDFVEWEFSGGSATGEIIEMTAKPGDSLSAGGNEFTIDEEGGENDEPLYKMQEWDESEGEEGEFTNNVVKFEAELSSADRPEAAPENAPRNRSIEQIRNGKQQKTADKHVQIKGKDVELVKQDSESEPVINIPIQAMTEDRDGDLINDKGQESIIRQLKSGTVPLVPNHGVGQSEAHYGFEDIFGQFVDGENRNGTTVATARLLEGNQYAEKLIELLENDMPVGFSVGFQVLEGDERKEEGGLEIEKVDLMEVSAVGIPSNPDAVPQAMGSAVAMAKNVGLDKTEIVDSIKKAFNDTMSEKQNEDGTDQKEEQDSKSEEQEMKQMTSEDVEMAMEVISSKVSEHMGMAMDEAEDEIMGMLDEEGDMEEDEMDEEEEDEEDEEMSQSDASDHTEDEDEKSESAESEEKEKKTDEDLQMPENGKQGGKITEADESSEEEKSEVEKTEDPFAVRSL
ncbi:hypothetical protein OSG_eHP23_00205 [environmental Halophage eHP-23]|nr:hypothetical protein OSG_eHP23_00205 [environmental Halophage eHP-23]